MNWCDAVARLHSSRALRRDPDWIDTELLKHQIQSYRTKHPGSGLSFELFDGIVAWKLRGQRGRTEQLRAELTPQNIAAVTEAAFSLEHPKRDVLAALRVRVLSSMPGIGTGVASAILALSFPAMYGVVDVRVWKVIFGKSKAAFTPEDYIEYLHELWACAKRLGLEPQVVDFLAWRSWESSQAGSEQPARGPRARAARTVRH